MSFEGGLMSTFDTLPNVHGVSEISLRSGFSTICSVTDERFSGEVIVTFKPGASLIEFVSFGEYIKEFDEAETTAEALTREIFDTIKEVAQPLALRVEIDVQSAAHIPAWCKIEEGYEQ
jgi:NADPH-dependent 7-cyano-7-deazaguanine reductase QueF